MQRNNLQYQSLGTVSTGNSHSEIILATTALEGNFERRISLKTHAIHFKISGKAASYNKCSNTSREQVTSIRGHQ
jgi:hypothetical protein